MGDNCLQIARQTSKTFCNVNVEKNTNQNMSLDNIFGYAKLLMCSEQGLQTAYK